MLPRVLLAVALYVCAFDVLARDRAVLVYPRERWSLQRVFYTRHQANLMRELEREYELVVHRQVATDDELFAIDVTGAKLLVLSGHGDPFAIYFADRHQRTLDASDRTRLAAFLAKLDPSATILLQSCDTARGFAHLVKELAGPMRRVIAAKGEVPVDGVHIGALQPLEVTITCREPGGATWDCTSRL